MLVRALALAFLFLSVGLDPTLTAQERSQSTTQVDTDNVDSLAFATLFRRENAYLKAAQAAKSPDAPETQLPRVIPDLFKLNSTQASSLERFASTWEAEVTPIRLQMMAAVDAFHRSFPNGRLNANADPTPPAAIRTLRRQIDTATLRYRDQLRNAMPEPAFQAELRQSFARNVGASAERRLVNGGDVQ